MRIGVCGLGFMGVTHLQVYRSLPGVEIAGVSGGFKQRKGNFDRGEEPLDLTGVRPFADWRELVASSDVDAVDICLPSDLHAEVSEAALRAGKHVICEKPLALREEDSERVLRAAAESRRVFMVAHVLRFWPEYVYLQNWARSGEYGRVMNATFTRSAGVPEWSSWLTDEARSGGAVVDMLVHDIDQILMLFGTPQKVTAKSMGIEDTVAASFLYGEKGREVRLQGGWLAAGAPLQMSFQVRAEKGLLELSADGLWLTDLNGKREKALLPDGDGFREELEYFVECCRTGARPGRCLPEESAEALKVALRVRESRAKEGEQISC